MIWNRGPERAVMKKQFSEEQIVAILREGQVGQKSVQQLCREHGVSRKKVPETGSSVEPRKRWAPIDHAGVW